MPALLLLVAALLTPINTDKPALARAQKKRTPQTAKPEAGKSAEAVKSLRASLAGKPATLASLAEKDFARVALTKADTATARTPRTMAVMLKTLSGRGDPKLMFTAEIAVEIPAEK